GHEKRVQKGPHPEQAGQHQDHPAERVARIPPADHPCPLPCRARSRSSTVTNLGSRNSLLNCDEKTREPDITSRAGPSATTSPSPSSTTLSARCAASSTSWVASTMVQPAFLRPRRIL